jgi:hypothetical protein
MFPVRCGFGYYISQKMAALIVTTMGTSNFKKLHIFRVKVSSTSERESCTTGY